MSYIGYLTTVPNNREDIC